MHDNETPSVVMISITKADLLSAWAVLENLAVSLDQIGGFYGRPESSGEEDRHTEEIAFALQSFLTPKRVQEIKEARGRLANYIADAEADVLVEKINYWDYVDVKQVQTAT